jgi:hypothetical protein
LRGREGRGPWPASLLLGREDAIPVLRRSLDLELRNPATVEVVDGREMARRGEQAVIEEAEGRRPILAPVSPQQGAVPSNKLFLLDGLGRQRSFRRKVMGSG